MVSAAVDVSKYKDIEMQLKKELQSLRDQLELRDVGAAADKMKRDEEAAAAQARKAAEDERKKDDEDAAKQNEAELQVLDVADASAVIMFHYLACSE